MVLLPEHLFTISVEFKRRHLRVTKESLRHVSCVSSLWSLMYDIYSVYFYNEL